MLNLPYMYVVGIYKYICFVTYRGQDLYDDVGRGPGGGNESHDVVVDGSTLAEALEAGGKEWTPMFSKFQSMFGMVDKVWCPHG